MRIKKEIIIKNGERLSSNSKFYLYQEQIYEPCYYNWKKTGTYKLVTDIYRLERILGQQKTRRNKQKSAKQIIEEIFNTQHNTKIENRNDLLDLD
ncbi:hypothetical protein LCGC14_0920280 [marine sediment metagenome]|uniref:Uncharacterized protein n=1 Tax=marine sediment metagenome TaxID=412755 RepID=A0A0F9RXN5_9ZZZZ